MLKCMSEGENFWLKIIGIFKKNKDTLDRFIKSFKLFLC